MNEQVQIQVVVDDLKLVAEKVRKLATTLNFVAAQPPSNFALLRETVGALADELTDLAFEINGCVER